MRRIKEGMALGVTVGLILTGCTEEVSDTARMEPMGPNVTQEADETKAYVDVPAIETLRFEPASPLAGRSVAVQVDMAEQADRLELSYLWTVGGRPVEGNKNRIDLTEAPPGARVQVTVTPWIRGTAGHPVSRAARLRSPAPRVMGVSFSPPGGHVSGVPIEARPMVEDGNPHSMRYRFQWIVNGRREGVYDATFDTSGLRRGDKIQVEVMANSDGAASDPFVSEEIVLGNAAPRLAKKPLRFTEDGSLDVRLDAPDPDGDTPVQFSLVRGPSGLALSKAGQLTWAASDVTPGSHAIEIEVADADGAKRTSRFSLDVGVPAAPAD